MGKAPAFQLYASDFYIDTNSWTVDELGIYTRLLLSQWVNGALPSEENRLARIAGCGVKRFLAGWSQVQVKFHLNGNGTYINDRLEEERAKQVEYKELQSLRGKKSANKRWGTPVTTVITTVKPALQPDCNSSSSSSSSSLKNKEKEEKYIAEVTNLIDFYFREFKTHFFKEPIIQGGKDGSIAKSLLKKIPLKELQELLMKFFESDDKFIQQSGYTLGVFKSQINKLRIGTQKQSGLRAWAQEIKEEEDASGQKAISDSSCLDGGSVQGGDGEGTGEDLL